MAAADSGSYSNRRVPWKGGCVQLFAALFVTHVAFASAPGTSGSTPSDPASLLRKARANLERGELASSIALFERVARAHPVVGDYADLLRARALDDAGESAQAVAVILEALEAYPQSRLRAVLYQKLGDIRLSYADEAAARSAWNQAFEATRKQDLRAELLRRLAESNEREENLAEAYANYREIWAEHPTHEYAAAAEERLSHFEAAGVAEPPSARDWQRRGDKLLRAHLNERALASYDTALRLGLGSASQRRARKQRAHTLFRMRRYREAVEAFAALPTSAEQRLWHARSLARADRVLESIDELEKLAREGHGEIGVRSMYLAGLLLDGRDFSERARVNFEGVAGNPSYPGLALGALWRLAWREYLDGDCGTALPRFERLIELETDPVLALRYRYWRARSLEKLDRPGAASEYASMARSFPFTYYGWRSSFRVSLEKAREPMPPRSIESGPPRLEETALLRPRILLAAGYAELAREELRSLRNSPLELNDRLELARLMSEAGDFYASYRVVQPGGPGTLAAGPLPAEAEMWWYAWPDAYAAEVDAAIRQPGAAGRELVYAIMREESGYRASVLSPAGAYGLMQIMPETGERLARDTGRSPFETDDLLKPEINVMLGAHYLGELSARFPERLSAAIASYNAGPSPVEEWLARDPEREDDEWVETIPYDQTRRYVKRVLRSVHAYRVLY